MSIDGKKVNQVFDFALPALGSQEFSRLSEQLPDKHGAVVVFWSGVCSHCVRYDGYLNDFENRHPSVALLAVAARQGESKEQLLAALSDRDLRFPILHDADRSIAHRCFVRQTPTAFLIDTNLQVTYRGAIDNFKYPQDPNYEPYLDAAIEALLGDRTPARTETATFGCPIESVYYRLPKPLGR